MAFDKTESTGVGALQSSMSEEKVSDHALIEAARTATKRAFGEIMARYRNPITNYLYRFLKRLRKRLSIWPRNVCAGVFCD